MINYQRLFHTGLLVPDLKAAMAQYGKALNVEWATPFTFDALPLWTPSTGVQHLTLEVTFSVEGPQHLEIQKGAPGSFYDPQLSRGFHVGCWVDDVPTEVRALQSLGWTVIAAGAPPEAGYGSFVYLNPPAEGLVVELVSTDLQPNFDRWWSGAGSLA